MSDVTLPRLAHGPGNPPGSAGKPGASSSTTSSSSSSSGSGDASNSQKSSSSAVLPPIEQRQLIVPKDPIQQFFEKRESEPNPFVLPNEDVFLLREKEREEKAAERARNLNTKIWDKHSAENDTVAISQIRVARARPSNASGGVSGAGGAGAAGGGKKAADCVFQGRRREKENMAEFIAKKRETFLIQMALDCKKAEVQKLEDKARAREETLRRAEIMLEDDAMRFDAFLKDNDRKAHQALQRAEQETKGKQDKALQVRKLVQAITKVESDILKADEQLKSCLKYKHFLDSRTPPEHFQQVAAMRAAAAALKAEVKAQRVREKEARRVRRIARAEARAARAAEKEARRRAREAQARARVKNSYYGIDEEEDAARPESSSDSDGALDGEDTDSDADASGDDDDGSGGKKKAKGDGEGADEEEDDDDEDEVDPMYFTKPEQLLEVFSKLEERNLFLIQSVQETEEAAEDVRRRNKATQEQMQAKTELLEKNIADLKAKIAHEQAQVRVLFIRMLFIFTHCG